MNPVEDELKRLNDGMFRAENNENVEGEPWEPYLRRVLSDDFRLRRGNGAVQIKCEMIDQIKTDNRRRNPPAGVKITPLGNYAVVTSVVTVVDDPDQVQYQNLKVFRRQDAGPWQCVYWRVDRPGKGNNPA